MDKRLIQENAAATGDDGLAPFHLWNQNYWAFGAGPPFTCQNCDKPCNTVIRYSNAKNTGILPALRRYGVTDLRKSILKHPNDVLGVDCGCYGRFQRQIAYVRAKRTM